MTGLQPQDRHIDAFAKFAERIEVEWAKRTHRPPSARLAEAIDPPKPAASSENARRLPDAQKLTDGLWKAQKHVREALDFIVDLLLGMSINEARSALRQAPDLAGFKRRMAQARTAAEIPTRATTRAYVRVYDLVAMLVPALIEGARLVIGFLNDTQEAKQRAARRADSKGTSKARCRSSRPSASREIPSRTSTAGFPSQTSYEERLKKRAIRIARNMHAPASAAGAARAAKETPAAFDKGA